MNCFTNISQQKVLVKTAVIVWKFCLVSRVLLDLSGSVCYNKLLPKSDRYDVRRGSHTTSPKIVCMALAWVFCLLSKIQKIRHINKGLHL